MRIGSMRVVVVFSSFLLFFSGGPGGLSPPEGRFPPTAPDIFPYPIEKSITFHLCIDVALYYCVSLHVQFNTSLFEATKKQHERHFQTRESLFLSYKFLDV